MIQALSWSKSCRFWWIGVRPKTLLLSICPVLLGSLLAFKELGHIHLVLMCSAIFSAVLVQAGTNLVNDGMDFLKGTDTPARLGPPRISTMGMVPPAQVFRAGVWLLGLAGFLAIPLVIAGGWPIGLFVVASLFAGYGYTAGPYPIAYIGGAELFVVAGFGWGAVAVPFFVQTGVVHPDVWLVGTEFGLLAALPLALNNLRDLAEDQHAHKRTLAVRWGRRFAEWEIAALLITSWLLGFYWNWQHTPSQTWVLVLVLPLIFWMIAQLRHPNKIPSLFLTSLVVYILFFLNFLLFFVL